jgi:hypothetical protein
VRKRLIPPFVSSVRGRGFRLSRVELEIKPEPEDRDAVVAAAEALLRLNPLPEAYRSAWREQGVLENVEEDTDL